jgi:O-antigen/teichoic acid export membrane protein
MGYGALLELGLAAALVRYVADLRERGKLEELRAIVATGFVIASGLAALTVIAGLILAPYAPDLFHVPAEQRETTRLVIVAAAASAGMTFPSGTLFAVLHGLQRFDIGEHAADPGHPAARRIHGRRSAGRPRRRVGCGGGRPRVAGRPGPGAPPDTQGRARSPPRRSPTPKALVRRLFSFSWAIVIMQGAGLLKSRTDELVIAAVLPVARVTAYAVARRASEAPAMLTYQFTEVIMPLAAQLGARNEQERLRRVVFTGTRLTVAAYSPAPAASWSWRAPSSRRGSARNTARRAPSW